MTRGPKLFLAFGGVFATIGVILLASSKNASAATPEVKPPVPTDAEPVEPDQGVVVVPPDGPEEPVTPPVVVPMPSNDLDINEIGRLLLRWYAAEGDSLLHADAVPSVDVLRSQGFPVDWGSTGSDLGNVVTPRHTWMAKAFRFLQGMSDAASIPESSGAIDAALLKALRAWAKSQEIAPAAQAPDPTTPAPIVITDPAAPSSPPIVIVPPADSGPTLPVSFPAPAQAGPPPFVPPLPTTFEPAPAPAPGPAPAVVPSVPIAPPAPAAQQPAMAPADTVRLVTYLLNREGSKGWKLDRDPEVMAWQKSRGLTQDGRFGPKSALTVATELGTVPIVRFWPKGTYPEGKWINEYRAALLTLANAAAEPRASQLRHSAEREQGQGFGTNPAALPSALLLNLQVA